MAKVEVLSVERLGYKIAPVDAAAVRAAFEAHPDTLDELQLSHILVRVGAAPPPRVDQRTDAQALALIESIRQELVHGVDFETLAKKYSEDAASVSDGGRLPPMYRKDLKDEVAPAVRALRQGEVSAPIRGLDGYHLIRLDALTVVTLDTRGIG